MSAVVFVLMSDVRFAKVCVVLEIARLKPNAASAFVAVGMSKADVERLEDVEEGFSRRFGLGNVLGDSAVLFVEQCDGFEFGVEIEAMRSVVVAIMRWMSRKTVDEISDVFLG